MLNLKHNQYVVSLIDETMYTPNSTDNIHTYEFEYVISDDKHIDSRHGLNLYNQEKAIDSCILIASGGPTRIHANSAAIVDQNIYIAVGNVLCSLSLPSLDLQWWQKVDFAACFGVYYHARLDCLITHGECDISRISKSGDAVWSKSGKDIFTEGFGIQGDHINTTDFNHEKYQIRVKDGQMKLVSG